MQHQSITDILQSDLENNENVRRIFQRYEKRVARFIKSEIPMWLNRRLDAEILAETSLREGLRLAKDGELIVVKSSVFLAALITIARRRVVDAIRFETWEKRDVRRDDQGADVSERLIVGREIMTPEDEAIVNETHERFLAELKNEPDERRIFINVAHFCRELKPTQIESELEPNGFERLSAPTIRRYLDKTRARLQRLMQSDGY